MPKPMFVWSGSAWVSVASEVESLANFATQSYADNTPGLRMVVPTSVAVGSGSGSVDTNGAVTFSGASSISLNGCFTSTYQNYRFVLNNTALSTSTSINLRLRKAGTDTLGTAYRGAYWSILGSTQTITGHDGQDSARMTKTTSNGYANFVADIFTPLSGSATSIYGNGVYSSTSDREIGAFGYQTAVDAFDGFTLFSASGTMTGTLRVYGYKN